MENGGVYTSFWHLRRRVSVDWDGCDLGGGIFEARVYNTGLSFCFVFFKMKKR